jgi:hypothetical protein
MAAQAIILNKATMRQCVIQVAGGGQANFQHTNTQ